VKRPTSTSSLVAMTTSQVPILAWERRYMTFRECARLQSLDELEHLPTQVREAVRALGNAVNAEVAKQVAAALVGEAGRTPRVTEHNNGAITSRRPTGRQSSALPR
jgi:DNA (cytosine-5)-methyltransferase 1